MFNPRKVGVYVLVFILVGAGIAAGRWYEQKKQEVASELKGETADWRPASPVVNIPAPKEVTPLQVPGMTNGVVVVPSPEPPTISASSEPTSPPPAVQQEWGRVVRTEGGVLVISQPGAMNNGTPEQREIEIRLTAATAINKGVYDANGTYKVRKGTVEELTAGRLVGVTVKRQANGNLEAVSIELNERL